MNIELRRYAYLPKCTLGRIRLGALSLFTLEEPFIPNAQGPGGAPMFSCVPDGDYVLEPHSSTKHPNTFALVNHLLGVYHGPGDIPSGQKYGRSDVLIHKGNTVADTEGCILVGQSVGFMPPSLIGSKLAYDSLMTTVGAGPHQLSIRPIAGTSEFKA